MPRLTGPKRVYLNISWRVVIVIIILTLVRGCTHSKVKIFEFYIETNIPDSTHSK